MRHEWENSFNEAEIDELAIVHCMTKERGMMIIVRTNEDKYYYEENKAARACVSVCGAKRIN